MAAFCRVCSSFGSFARKLLDKQNNVCHIRQLHLQEYQSKRLMEGHSVAVQQFDVADSVQGAEEIAHKLKVKEYVVKAQILAGGRGKGTFIQNNFKGGVHLTKDPKVVKNLVKNMLGNNLVTKQTTQDGVPVKKVMIAEALDIERETYFAILMDRQHNGPVMVGSPRGGVNIEEVAETDPAAIFTVPIDIMDGIQENQVLTMADNLGFTGAKKQQAADQMTRLYNLFLDVDATQVEINPLGETPDGKVVCFDAKIEFDDNAHFRQKDIFSMEDWTESDPREIEAAQFNLNYIAMEGNIACLVNGAGLAMATMDIIKLHGGNPANFLDLGGGVKEEDVYNAFRLMTHDKHIKAILVNIFGGIVNCATIAKGITNACKSIHLELPLVVRLEGTNVDEAKTILKESGLAITSASDLDDAARKAVTSAV